MLYFPALPVQRIGHTLRAGSGLLVLLGLLGGLGGLACVGCCFEPSNEPSATTPIPQPIRLVAQINGGDFQMSNSPANWLTASASGEFLLTAEWLGTSRLHFQFGRGDPEAVNIVMHTVLSAQKDLDPLVLLVKPEAVERVRQFGLRTGDLAMIYDEKAHLQLFPLPPEFLVERADPRPLASVGLLNPPTVNLKLGPELQNRLEHLHALYPPQHRTEPPVGPLANPDLLDTPAPAPPGVPAAP